MFLALELASETVFCPQCTHAKSSSTKPFLAYIQKKRPHPGCVQASMTSFISLLQCLCSLLSFCVFSRCRCIVCLRGRFPQTRRLKKRVSFVQRVGRASSHAVSSFPWSLRCGGLVVCLKLRMFVCFCFILFSDRTQTDYGMYQAAFPHLPLY